MDNRVLSSSYPASLGRSGKGRTKPPSQGPNETPRYSGAARARRKFQRIFPGGFGDETYIAWERDYKWQAHERWMEQLDKASYRKLLEREAFAEIAARAVAIEARTNLIFSFEKMALRDAVRPRAGAQAFAHALYDFLYGRGAMPAKFDRWCEAVAHLPRKQTRVLTWPIVTVFGFIAQPDRHFFVKPNVTRAAGHDYGFPLQYKSRPDWQSYASILDFADQVATDIAALRPRDMIDLQSFIWVQGSAEYAA